MKLTKPLDLTIILPDHEAILGIKAQFTRNQGRSISQIHNAGHCIGQIRQVNQETTDIFKRSGRRNAFIAFIQDVTKKQH